MFYKHTLKTTITSTLRQWVSMWQVFVGEGPLLEQVLTHLLEVVTLSLPYQEKIKSGKTLHVETTVPKAVRTASCWEYVCLLEYYVNNK